jgi:hypothetical protein
VKEYGPASSPGLSNVFSRRKIMAGLIEKLVWVALPNGMTVNAEGRQVARISVFLSPRLRGGAKLGDFPDFLNWPEQVSAARFEVEVDSGEVIEARIASGPPESALWLALFGADTPVRSHTFDDYADRPIISVANRQVLNYLKDVYGQIAARSPDELPYILPGEGEPGRVALSVSDVLGALVDMQRQGVREMDDQALSALLESQVEAARQEARRRRAANQRGGALIEPPVFFDNDDPRHAFSKSMLFHYRPGSATPVDLPDGEQDTRSYFTEQIDFHQMLSAMDNYPALQRRLGVVIDLEIEAEALPKTPDELHIRKLRLRPHYTPTNPEIMPEDYLPWTKYWNTSLQGVDLFIPLSQSGEISAGLWTPPAADLDLVQMDVDGAVMKMLNTASTIARQEDINRREGLPLDSPERDGIPALRSKGVSLVLTGRAGKMNERFNRSLDLDKMIDGNPPQQHDLYAEDLLRGYRLDVLDEAAGDWLSLHQRSGTYEAAQYADGTITIRDEGFVQPSVTEPPRGKNTPPDPAGELYVHESLFTWDGWSLSAPRVGKSLSRSPRAPTEGDEETQPQNVPNTAMTAMQLEVQFQPAPGTLPRLRFGHIYQVRVRTVDLAGNSLEPKEADQLMQVFGAQLHAAFPQKNLFIYARFEPVGAPELSPRQVFSEGESVERMVIRSNFDQTSDAYAAAHPAGELDPDHPGYLPVNERHVIPPKASQHLVETHGMLDAAFNARRQGLPEEQVNQLVRDTYTLSIKEKGSLNDPAPEVTLVRTGGTDEAPQVYAVHGEEQLVLPYLPDPWSAGAVFYGLPGMPAGEPFIIKWDGPAWHELIPFRIRLTEGSGAPSWDGENHILSVQLEKSAVAAVRVSSLFGGRLRVMGLWQWLEEMDSQGKLNPPPSLDDLSRMVMEGRHWMFTPYRRLALVHAVQQPLQEPFAEEFNAARWFGETAAHLAGHVRYHSPSSAKLDLLAHWTEWLDDLSQNRPETKEARAHVLDLPASFDGLPGRLADPLLRDVLQLVDDASLLIFTTRVEDRLQDLLNRLKAPGLTVEEQRRLADLINLVMNLRPHEFGDTKYRQVTYRFEATSRFREYFAPAITQDPANLTRPGEECVVEMLSTGHPSAPQLLYVIPTYGWEQSANEGTVTSIRRGGGLRIYLDRPWYSSGAGELLGVVVSGQLPDRWTGLDEELKPSTIYPYDTYWGDDPLWVVEKVPKPAAADFRNAVAVGHDLRLIEKPDTRVTVYGHEVVYDEDRRLWYCDLDLSSSNFYAPFIRLALVRYQPNSLPDSPGSSDASLHVSAVVATEIVQTAPDRILTLSRAPGDASQISVSLTGPAPLGRHGPAGAPAIQATNQVTVTLEKRAVEIPDETLGWQPWQGPDADPLPPIELSAVTQPGGVGLWTGTVEIPVEAAMETLRLVIRELEPFENFTPDQPAERGKAWRLVYMDIIPIASL